MKIDAFIGRRVEIERHLVVAMGGQFPVIARGAEGLAAVFRVGAGHYGLTATLATSHSRDGRAWSSPVEVWPRGEDVRNPALGVLASGAWVLAYWEAGMYSYPAAGGERAWKSPRDGGEAPDMFIVRSTDRGATWSARVGYRSEAFAWLSPFGRILEHEGTLLLSAYGGRRNSTDGRATEAVILRSHDGGLTWGDESVVCTGANETSLCVVGDRLVAAIRRTDLATSIAESTDGGRTWSAPRLVTRPMEHPADLTVLPSGALMLTFGRRIRPLGAAAIVSTDGGATWNRDREVLLAGDGIGNDVGYPSTVLLDDGTLVTALYFAHGSAGSEGGQLFGELSCQVLRYPAALVEPER